MSSRYTNNILFPRITYPFPHPVNTSSDDELNKLSWEFARYKETHAVATTDLTGNDGVATAATATVSAAAVLGEKKTPFAASGETEGGGERKAKEVDKKVSSGSVSFHPQVASPTNDNNSGSKGEEDKPLSVAGQLTGLFSMFGSPPSK